MNPDESRDFFLHQIMIKYIFKRVLILIVPVLLVLIFHLATFDEHKRCIGNEHRHVDGFLGIAMLSIFWLSTCGSILLIDIVLEFFKRLKLKV